MRRAHCAAPPFAARSPEHHAAGDADADHVDPALHEIEQMGVEQRTNDILHHDDEADPRHQAGAAKQQEMGNPHRPQHERTDEAKLDGDREGLVMRIGGRRRWLRRYLPTAARSNSPWIEPVPWPMMARRAMNCSDFLANSMRSPEALRSSVAS